MDNRCGSRRGVLPGLCKPSGALACVASSMLPGRGAAAGAAAAPGSATCASNTQGFRI